MTRALSLAHLTVLPLAPPALVDTAAAAGFSHVGVRLQPAVPGALAYPLMDEPELLRATRERLAATGLGVLDIEIARLDEAFEARSYLPFLEAGAALGASAILVAGVDRDPARLAASFAAFCEAAGPFGLSANIEPMPWTAVPDVAAGVSLIEAAGTPDNAGLLVDAIHFARSGSSLAEVEALPRSWLNYVQLCDAPAEVPAEMGEIVRQARVERRLPGEGGIDLAGLLAALPAGLPVSVEAPNDKAVAAQGLEAWAQRAFEAARSLVAG